MPLLSQPGTKNRKTLANGAVDMGQNILHEGPHITRGPLAQPQVPRSGFGKNENGRGRARGSYEGTPSSGLSGDNLGGIVG
jgi:hypothetical protein